MTKPAYPQNHSTSNKTAHLSLPINDKNPIILNASRSAPNPYQTQGGFAFSLKLHSKFNPYTPIITRLDFNVDFTLY